MKWNVSSNTKRNETRVLTNKFEQIQVSRSITITIASRRVQEIFVLTKFTEKRLKYLKKKLDRNPEMLKKYDQIIKNQLDEGIVEKVVTKAVMGEVTYSPLRAVIREDKVTTKIRVVYDLSAKNKGPSINECLYRASFNAVIIR